MKKRSSNLKNEHLQLCPVSCIHTIYFKFDLLISHKDKLLKTKSLMQIKNIFCDSYLYITTSELNAAEIKC